MHLSIVSTKVRRAGNTQEIYRLLLPEGRTFDENIFSQGKKIEYPRADLTFFQTNVIAVSLWMKHIIRRSLPKFADSGRIIEFLSL